MKPAFTIFNHQGFVLMDLVMVIGLLPMLLLALFSTSQVAGNSLRSQNVIQTLNHDGMQMLRTLTRELSQSNPISGDGQFYITEAAPNDSVRFRVPVDYDNDGDVTGSAEDVFEWGASASSNAAAGWVIWQNYWIRYQVISGTLYREVLDTSLTLVAGYQKALAKNVGSFQLAQNGNLITVTISFTEQDVVGQAGQGRSYTQSYVLTSQTMMRNVVDAE